MQPNIEMAAAWKEELLRDKNRRLAADWIALGLEVEVEE